MKTLVTLSILALIVAIDAWFRFHSPFAGVLLGGSLTNMLHVASLAHERKGGAS